MGCKMMDEIPRIETDRLLMRAFSVKSGDTYLIETISRRDAETQREPKKLTTEWGRGNFQIISRRGAELAKKVTTNGISPRFTMKDMKILKGRAKRIVRFTSH